MRFRRWPGPTPYEVTSRKEAAFRRKQRLEREALPLFSDMIAANQPSVEDEMARRTVRWSHSQQTTRDQRASRWREARKRLFTFDAEQRRQIRSVWKDCPYPAGPSYFADFLRDVSLGKADLSRPPWIFNGKLSPRTTPNPSAFDEAFKQIGKKTIGGGPKTIGADEFIFMGNLGSGLLFLTSRVKLVEPNESFYTSSNHRLRDSHVGREGHWVEITVNGACSYEELDLIWKLAQAADTRPVVVCRSEAWEKIHRRKSGDNLSNFDDPGIREPLHPFSRLWQRS